MVMAKKQEKEALKDELDDLKSKVIDKEKEITPIYNKLLKNNDSIKHEQFLQLQYHKDIEYVKNQIAEVKITIDLKNKEIKHQTKEINSNVKDLNLHINTIKNEMAVNRANHKREKIELENLFIHKKEEFQVLRNRLENLISVHNEKKNVQGDRLRKMNNKRKMFIGILKH